MRPARALPYELFVHVHGEGGAGKLSLRFVNTGRAGAVFLVYTAFSSKRRAPIRSKPASAFRMICRCIPTARTTYGVRPERFSAALFGTPIARSWWNGSAIARPEVAEGYDVANGNLQLRLENVGSERCVFTSSTRMTRKTNQARGARRRDRAVYLDLRKRMAGMTWRSLDTDPTFARRLAGHVETGNSSMRILHWAVKFQFGFDSVRTKRSGRCDKKAAAVFYAFES